MKFNLNHIIILFFTLLLISCSKENIVPIDNNNGVFNIIVNSKLEEKLYDSRGESYGLIRNNTALYYGNQKLNLKNFSIRGGSALDFRRKSFSVGLSEKTSISSPSLTSDLMVESFKLSSMPFDFTYIESFLSFQLLEMNELWNLKTFYTQLMINNNHQGLYMFIENPEEYAFSKWNAEVVIRRYYRHQISKTEINPEGSPEKTQFYIDQFYSIYELIKKYSGQALYNKLADLINLDHYMRKMAVDFLLGNGDYSDEIYFCAVRNRDNQIFFEIIPWDYDDIFSDTPHEVGRDWAVGTAFGNRIYNSHQDVLNELNGRLVFSIEDDLDYIIAKDDFLYGKYLEQLKLVLSSLNNPIIDHLFLQIETELAPFYQIEAIIYQSKYDKNETSVDILSDNLAVKKEWLKTRLNWIKNEFEKQK